MTEAWGSQVVGGKVFQAEATASIGVLRPRNMSAFRSIQSKVTPSRGHEDCTNKQFCPSRKNRNHHGTGGQTLVVQMRKVRLVHLPNVASLDQRLASPGCRHLSWRTEPTRALGLLTGPAPPCTAPHVVLAISGSFS